MPLIFQFTFGVFLTMRYCFRMSDDALLHRLIRHAQLLTTMSSRRSACSMSRCAAYLHDDDAPQDEMLITRDYHDAARRRTRFENS